MSGTCYIGFSQGLTSRPAFETNQLLYLNQLNYNKYKAKSVVLAFTVLDQITQKYGYLTVWMPIFLYGQSTHGVELESCLKTQKPNQRVVLQMKCLLLEIHSLVGCNV